MTRGEALKILDTIPTIGEQVDALEMAIKALEQPERKTGKWDLRKDGSGVCSECHFHQKNVWDLDSWQNFCGVCGADMRGEQDET